MFHYAHPSETPEADELAGVETVTLGYSLAQAFHLWAAYQNGILPRQGGLLDQPRAFQKVIELLNARHYRMQKLSEEDVADRRMLYREDLNPLGLIPDAPAVTSFDAFMRRG